MLGLKPNNNVKLLRPVENLNSSYFVYLLSKINWLPLYIQPTVEDSFEYFLDVFLNAVNIAFPVKQVKVTMS